MGINKESCTKEYREFSSFAEKHAVLKECKSMQELAEKVLSNDSTRELFPLVAQLMVHALGFCQYQLPTVRDVSVP